MGVDGFVNNGWVGWCGWGEGEGGVGEVSYCEYGTLLILT